MSGVLLAISSSREAELEQERQTLSSALERLTAEQKDAQGRNNETLQARNRALLSEQEQKLAAEAWKVTDKEFVDRSFGGQDWFQRRQGLIKATKATSREDTYDEIRAMLASLDDKYTRFLTPAMYDAVFSVATGDVAGIGVELEALGGDPFAKGGGIVQ